MNAIGLIEQAKTEGMTLGITGGKLRISGPKTDSAQVLVNAMAEHKPEIMRILFERGNTVAPGFYRRSFGTIRPHDGAADVHPADAIFAVEGTALYMPEDAGMYKRYLWAQMQRSENVLAVLYEICNLAYVGVNVYVHGNNAKIIADAANYLLTDNSKPDDK